MASGEVFGLEAASFKRLLSCVFGIIIAFCIYGLLLESMTKGSHISEIGLILLLTNVYSIVAVIILRCTGEPLEHPSKWPAKLSFCLISFSYMAAMWCSTRALRFVNYPTQVLGKSCKAVPIVLISTCMGTRYTCGEYLAVILIVAGVAIFNMYRTGKGGGASLEERGISSADNAVGLALVGMSLLFDGLTGALEDKVVKQLGWGHGKGTFQLMFYINFFCIPISLFGVVLEQGGLSLPSDTDMLARGAILGLAGALGQFFIFYTISHFGALACSIITTCRKVMTIIFSVIFFGHVLTSMQVAGLGVSISGFALNIHEKKLAKARRAAEQQANVLELAPMNDGTK